MKESLYKLVVLLNKNFKPLRFSRTGKPHYQIYLKIESDVDPKLDKIEKVEYILHPTFKKRNRIVTSRENYFQLELKAWGTFVTRIILYKVDGTKEEFTQDMKSVLIETYI